MSSPLKIAPKNHASNLERAADQRREHRFLTGSLAVAEGPDGLSSSSRPAPPVPASVPASTTAAAIAAATAATALKQQQQPMNPLKPSLYDVARMFLQDHGEEVAGRPLEPNEQAFVNDAHRANVSVNYVRDLFTQVDDKIREKVEAAHLREYRREKENAAVEKDRQERMTFTEYQKYLRRKGLLNDEREDVPEGNLIPILAVLQGQAEGVGFLKRQCRVIKIGDHLVEVDPTDPAFAKYFPGAAEQNAEDKSKMPLFHNGKRRDAETMTEPPSDDSIDAEIFHCYERIEELLAVVDAVTKSKLQAELFTETALSRIVVLRKNADGMYDRLETGQRTMEKITVEAITQNERLWKKLEMIAMGGMDDASRKRVQRTFTAQIERLDRLVSSLKLRLELTEKQAMQLVADGHYQETVHEKKMDELRRMIIPKPVKDEMQTILQLATSASNNSSNSNTVSSPHRDDAAHGGDSAKQLRLKLDGMIDTLMYQSTSAVDQAEHFTFTIPREVTFGLQSATESLFASLDEVAKQAYRHMYDMVMNPHAPSVVLMAAGEAKELLPEIRSSTANGIAELTEVTLRALYGLQKSHQAALRTLQIQMDTLQEEHEVALKTQEQELTKFYQNKFAGSMSVEQFEREKGKLIAKERERVLNQLGRDVPFPSVVVPRLAPFPLLNQNLLAHGQPQDLIEAISQHLTELTMESCQVLEKLNQPLPQRISEISQVLAALRTLQQTVTTHEGLTDAIKLTANASSDSVVPEATSSAATTAAAEAAAGGRPLPAAFRRGSGVAPSTSNSTAEDDLMEHWWNTAAGSNVGTKKPESREGVGNVPPATVSMNGSINLASASGIFDNAQSALRTKEETQQRQALQKAMSVVGVQDLASRLQLRTQLSEVLKPSSGNEKKIQEMLQIAQQNAEERRERGEIPMVSSVASFRMTPGGGGSRGGEEGSPLNNNRRAGRGGGKKPPLSSGSGAAVSTPSTTAVSTPAAEISIPRPKPLMVDRATSPPQSSGKRGTERSLLAAEKDSKSGSPSRPHLKRAGVLDEEAVQKRVVEVQNSMIAQFEPLHAAIEYLRLTFVQFVSPDPTAAAAAALDWNHILGPADPPTVLGGANHSSSSPHRKGATTTSNKSLSPSAGLEQYFMSSLVNDKNLLERLTGLMLQILKDYRSGSSRDPGEDSCEVESDSPSQAVMSLSSFDAVRKDYMSALAVLGHASRCKLLQPVGIDKGVSCQIVSGKEAILTSQEALDFALCRDLQVLSNKRKLQRLEMEKATYAGGGSTTPAVGDEAAQGGGDEEAPYRGGRRPLPPLQNVLGSPFASPASKVHSDATTGGGGGEDDPSMLSVRRLVHNVPTQQGSRHLHPTQQNKSVVSVYGEHSPNSAVVAYRRGKTLEKLWDL